MITTTFLYVSTLTYIAKLLDTTICSTRDATRYWIEQVGYLREYPCDAILLSISRGGASPPYNDCEIDLRDTPSNAQIAESATCSTPDHASYWMENLGHTTELVESELTHLYDVDLLMRLTSVHGLLHDVSW